MRVGPQGEARVGVAEVLTDRLDRLALVERGARVEVAQGTAPVLSLVGHPGPLKQTAADAEDIERRFRRSAAVFDDFTRT